VRSGSELTSDRVGELQPSTVVTVHALVYFPDGSIRARIDHGWITSVTKDGRDNLALVASEWAVVSERGLIVRAESELTSDKLGELPPGTVVTVHSLVYFQDGSIRARVDAGWITAVTKDAKDNLVPKAMAPVPPEQRRKPPVPERMSQEEHAAAKRLHAQPPPPPPSNLAIELLPSVTVKAAAKLKAARKALLSSGMGVELKGAIGERVTTWTLSNSGLPCDGLTPNQGELMELGKMIGLRVVEVTPYPGGARVALVEEEISPADFDSESGGKLANLGSSFKAVCLEMSEKLEQHHQKAAKLFLDTAGGYFGVSTLWLAQTSSSRLKIGEHWSRAQQRASQKRGGHSDVFPDRTPAVGSPCGSHTNGSEKFPSSVARRAAARVGAEAGGECSA